MFEIGNSLREARLRQNLDFPHLERATKIRAKYLGALEDERFELLPAHTYVKGFLRAYADYLGLDGQLYVDEYNSRYVSGEEEPPLRARRTAPGRARRRVEANVLLAALVGIAVVTALVIAAWKFGGGSSQQTALTGLGKPPAAATRAKRPAAAPPAQRPAPKTAKLELTAARGNCWFEIHLGSATGRQVFQGTLEQGRTISFTAKRLWLDAGAPWNVDVRVNGRAARLPQHSPSFAFVTRRGVTSAA